MSKSTPDEVMELACGLPWTRSVPRSVVADATPGQPGVLADLFRAENASRTESRRARLIRNAGFPCVKGFDGYDWGMASFPADWGASSSWTSVSEPGRGPRALRRRWMRQDAHGDRHGHAGVREGHAGEVLHRVVAGDAFAAGEGREPARRGTARDRPRQAAGHRRAGLPADRHRRGQAPVPGRRGFLREAERGVRHEPGVRTVGRGVRRRRHGCRGHRPHRAPRKDRQVPWRVIPQQPLPDEINEKRGTSRTAGNGVHFERRWCSD